MGDVQLRHAGKREDGHEEVGSKDQVHVLQLTPRSWEFPCLLLFFLFPSIDRHLLGGLDRPLILVW